jgi:hypothetical protein
VAMSTPQITYAPRDDTSTAVEVAALANLYAFLIRTSQAKRKAGRSNGSDNYEKQERRQA